MAKSKIKIRGTAGNDELTGTAANERVWGYDGDDLIASGEGRDKAWGGKGKDTFVTVNDGQGFVKIMDFELGDLIEFCGCASTRVEQRGKNVRIVKGDDVKAVLKGIDADQLNLDFEERLITLVGDSLGLG